MMKRFLYLFLCFFAVFPMILSFGASVAASLFHCEINEGVTTVCMAFGKDIGSLLSTLLICGWAALFTIPVSVFLFLLVVVLSGFSNKKTEENK